MRRGLGLLAVALTLATAACGPEASRTRDGGPGADVGNRGANIQLHPGTSQAYYGTPNLNPRITSSSQK